MNPRDLNTWHEEYDLPAVVKSGPTGKLYVDYEVRPYNDVRNLTSTRGYMISCKQRVVLPNDIDSQYGPSVQTSYSYPIMFLQKMFFNNVDGSSSSWYITEYSPKTLNSAVNANLTTGSGSSTQSSSQYTTGSSQSETNTYDVSVNAGFTPEGLTGGASATYGHSDTTTTEQSSTTGNTLGRDRNTSSSDGMSIKDWSSYSNLDFSDNSIQWVWGQEYPWDVLQFRYGDSTGIQLPAGIVSRLCILDNPTDPHADPAQVLPPSKLSLFGPNLVAKATWLYLVPNNTTSPCDQIQFTHQVIAFEGSHSIGEGTALTAQITQSFDAAFTPSSSSGSSPTTSVLDLGLLALDVVDPTLQDTGAIVGFVRSQFICEPDNANGFSLKSTANNLYVMGSGFTTPATSDAPMTADLHATSATMTIYFKVVDPDTALSLFIKHWKVNDTTVTMSIQINPESGTAPQTIDTFTRNVDWAESGSGSENVTEFILRKKSYTSTDYYDYLQLGLNKIVLTFSTTAASSVPCSYAVRALALA